MTEDKVEQEAFKVLANLSGKFCMSQKLDRKERGRKLVDQNSNVL